VPKNKIYDFEEIYATLCASVLYFTQKEYKSSKKGPPPPTHTLSLEKLGRNFDKKYTDFISFFGNQTFN